MNNSKKDYTDPRTVGQYVVKNIQQVHIYYLLAFKLIGSIKKNKPYDDWLIFDSIYEACLTKYVFALSKIFGNTKEATLWQLLKLTTELSKKDFEERLKKDSTNINERRQQWEELIKNRKDTEGQIKKIKDKLKPLRNAERAHNIPWAYREIEKQNVECVEIKEWLTFAEKILEKCMGVLGEFCLKAGSFGSPECNSEIKTFLALINDKNLEEKHVSRY